MYFHVLQKSVSSAYSGLWTQNLNLQVYLEELQLKKV